MPGTGIRSTLLGAAVLASLGYVFYSRLEGGSSPAKALAAEKVIKVKDASPASPGAQRLAARREQIVDAPWPPSPFALSVAVARQAGGESDDPAALQDVAAAGLVLRAVFSGDPRRALINDKILREGERLDEATTVLRIGALHVDLERRGVIRRLRMSN